MGESEPGIDVTPDDVLMLEIGVLLQQLLLLHDHTIGKVKPPFDEDAYDALIKSLWQRIINTTAIPPLFGNPVGDACHNLHMYWQKAVEERFDGRYVNTKWSYIRSEVEQIASLIERALAPTERPALWFAQVNLRQTDVVTQQQVIGPLPTTLNSSNALPRWESFERTCSLNLWQP